MQLTFRQTPPQKQFHSQCSLHKSYNKAEIYTLLCIWNFEENMDLSRIYSCKRNTRGKNESMAPKIIPQNWFNPLCTIFLHRLRPISTSRKDDPIHFKESTGIYFDEELHYWSAKKTSGRTGSMGVRFRRAPWLFF